MSRVTRTPPERRSSESSKRPISLDSNGSPWSSEEVLDCEFCGASNDSKLTFCRNCGEKLPKRTAPAAPRAPQAHEHDDAANAAGADDDRTPCEQCGVASPKEYRFCVGCGAVLPRVREVAPKALADAMGRQRRAGAGWASPPAPEPKARPEIKLTPRAEARAVPKAPPPAPPAPTAGSIVCDQCGSRCSATESFCRFCGEAIARPARAEARGVARREPAPELALATEPEDIGTREPDVEPATGRLVVIVEDGSEGETLELRGRQMDIGRTEGDIVLQDDQYLSPRHARLFRQNDRWYLRDLESLNGIYRRLHSPTSLRDGDRILLGLEVLQFGLVSHGDRGLGQAVENGVLLFGSPAGKRRARLAQRTIEGIARDVYHLINDETTIGREAGDIVFTSDPFMSRRHAMVKWDEGAEEFILSDLSSSNGTYLAVRDDVELEDGDFIRIGQHLFRVDLNVDAGER